MECHGTEPSLSTSLHMTFFNFLGSLTIFVEEKNRKRGGWKINLMII